MASKVQICNRALQKLGAGSITSLSDDSVPARECSRAYELVRDAELGDHPWRFAATRVQLTPLVPAPAFGPKYQYQLPSDYIQLTPDVGAGDWIIEGRKILTDDGDTLNVRYIRRETDTTRYHPLFVEALAARMAYEMAEKLTQSNTKEQKALRNYEDLIRRAKKANAIIQGPKDQPEDSWIVARR